MHEHQLDGRQNDSQLKLHEVSSMPEPWHERLEEGQLVVATRWPSNLPRQSLQLLLLALLKVRLADLYGQKVSHGMRLVLQLRHLILLPEWLFIRMFLREQGTKQRRCSKLWR